MKLIDVVHDEICQQQSHPPAEQADAQAITEENRGHAGAGRADAFDDADVARLFHDDHEEDAEDQEDRDDADDGEENDQQGFFMLDGIEEIVLVFVPGFDFRSWPSPRVIQTEFLRHRINSGGDFGLDEVTDRRRA